MVHSPDLVTTKKILIVDDQPQIRELIALTLQLGNYKILFAENGQQALVTAQTERPHLILLDVTLRGSDLDGLEVCRRLKKDPVTANISVIMLSGSGELIDIEIGREAGADDYLTKPFSPVKLMARVEAILEK